MSRRDVTTRVTVDFYETPYFDDELMSSEQARRIMQTVGDAVADDAYAGAPKDTTLGAQSISARTALGPIGWEVSVSWSRRRYYMTFHENGTVRLRRRPFLVPALESQRGRF